MISLRDATPEDTEAVVTLINTAFLVELLFIERDRTNADTVHQLMMKGKFILAEVESTLAGCVYAESRGERGYFGMLSVDPSRQRMGIGRRLISAVEDHFRDAGCKFVDLKIVDARAELLPYYLQLGYVEMGTAKYDDPVPTKIPVHFILMTKRLT